MFRICVAFAQVYKMHLVEGRAASGPAVDSARQNLASTFVNAFVNAGFGTDKLMTGVPHCGLCQLCPVLPGPWHSVRMASVSDRPLNTSSPGTSPRPYAGGAEEDPGAVHWIFKNKDQGKTAAAASLGLISLWDVEGGLPQIDKFLYSKDPHVVAGAPASCCCS